MRYYLTVLLIAITVLCGRAQTYEIGPFVGGANYIGDIGRTNYIAPNTLAFGGVFKWNRSARHSFRASVVFANIKGDDAKASDESRKQRGLSFENSVTEISIGLEYTFWEFNLHKGEPQSTPYLYTGLTYFQYEALVLRATGNIEDYDSVGSPAIPMVIGYKTSVGTDMVLAFEIGARYTFTDDLDGSNPVTALEDIDRFKFGNINSNDWYVFSGITLTFAFGRRPCYCNF